MANVLVVDDEVKLARLLAQTLEAAGHAVATCASAPQAIELLGERRFDVVVTDLRLGAGDGLTVLREARRQGPATEVVIMTAFATTETAVEALREGAADYLIKPFAIDELRIRIGRLVERRALEARARDLERKLHGPVEDWLVSRSAAMREVMQQIDQVAATEATVLLLGPSGSGKTLLAREIHQRSPRADGPLVEVHCAALPETLLESELFGHERGAFTGAVEAKRGQLELASRGTLFLDEIGEVSAAVQVKLLRFLQDREFLRVGGTQVRKVDVRIIAATNRDLGEAVREGRFREDFYYRLNVFPIRVPPLAERRDDLSELAGRILRRRGADPARLQPEALEALSGYGWPGNVRELENVLERALILAGAGPIERRHLPQAVTAPSPALDPGVLLRPGFSLDRLEREVIQQALAQAGGNKTEAARLLGITRRRLYSRLKSLEADEADEEAGEG